MTNKRKKLMTTAIAGSMAASIVIGGGTFAYLQSQTDDVVNEFKTEQVKVEISVSPHVPYDIIPGTEQDKDPSVTVKNTLESFVFLNVTDNTYGLVTYEIDDTIWTKLDGYENVYYKKVPAAVDENGTTLKVLKNDKVSYDKDLINEDMLDENGDLRTDVALSFNAFAIQARPFTDLTDPADPTTAPTEAAAAAAAYNQAAPIKVTTFEEFKKALDDVENGGVIRIDNDITNTNSEKVRTYYNKKFTIDLGGNTLDMNNERFYSDNSDITIKNGVLHSNTYGIQFTPTNNGDAHLTIAENAKIVSDVSCAIFVADVSNGSHSGVVDVYGKTEGNIFIHGTIKENSNIVVNVYGNIYGGEDTEREDIGIAVNGYATVNVKNGATVKSLTGIEVRAGKLNVEDGTTIIATAVPTTFTPNDSGTTTQGAGIGVSQHNTKMPIDVNITGGTVQGYIPLYEINPQNNSDAELAKIKINVTGGTFENINGGTTLFSIADRAKITYINALEQ